MSTDESRTIAPFGCWPSPIAAADVAKASRRFGHVCADGDHIYWTESRPEEGGRQAILRAPAGGGATELLLNAPYSANSRVHEYGGGEMLAVDGRVYFVNDRDQDVYVLEPGLEPERLTREPGTRFADLAFDRVCMRLVAVAERQTADPVRPDNLLVAIGLDGRNRGEVRTLTCGRDFYACPRLDPEGRRLAWIAWDLPGMPWDEAELLVAEVAADGTLGPPERIAGGSGSAASQPLWDAQGRLLYITDEAGNGILYRRSAHGPERISTGACDLARPMWSLGGRSFRPMRNGSVVWAEMDGIEAVLCARAEGAPTEARTRTGLAGLGQIVATESRSDAMIFATATRFAAATALVAIDGAPLTSRVVRESAAMPLPSAAVAHAELVTFAGGGGEPTYAFYYAPTSSTFAGPPGALPPLIVLAHGGPTGSVDAGLKLRVQFFTSRGFAVADVNYSGSVGYGRAYRERLDGRWGIADVADCAALARHLADARRVDSRRMVIAGGSAGGYTTLMALATTDVFAAGSCHFGISDLALLLAHTHKFESGYLHRLLGTRPDEWREVLEARSPIRRVGAVDAPVIFFQGLDDKVVPPEQSRLMHRTLREKGIDSEIHEFAGEGHGFRKAETITAVLTAELAFLTRSLNLDRDR